MAFGLGCVQFAYCLWSGLGYIGGVERYPSRSCTLVLSSACCFSLGAEVIWLSLSDRFFVYSPAGRHV